MFLNGGKINPNYLFLVFIITLSILLVRCGRSTEHLSICEIQGRESRTSYLGADVFVEGIITAELGDQDPPGFYLMGLCPDQGKTRGIWVRLENEVDWINLGDEIRMEGVVEEHNQETTIKAKTGTLEIISQSNEIPEPIDLAVMYHLDPLSFTYEDWEGELIYLPGSTVLINENDNTLLICPIFHEKIRSDRICDLGPNYYLNLRSSLPHPGLRRAASGDQVLAINGILRQEVRGYFIQILDAAAIRVQTYSAINSGLAWSNSENRFSSYTFETDSRSQQATPFETVDSVRPIPTSTLFPSPTYYPVNLLISEIHPNPVGEEPELEWIEIYNPTNFRIPLRGIKLGDEVSPEGKEGVLRFPEGYSIDAGEILLIANDGGAFSEWYGFIPDFEMYPNHNQVPELVSYSGWGGSKIQFSNTGDEVLLIDPWDKIIDQLAYGKSSWRGFFPSVPAPREGFSLERFPPERDRDVAEDWRERKGGSPGWLDRSQPTSTTNPTVSHSPSLSPTLTPSVTPTPSPTLGASATAIPTIIPSLTMTATIPLSLTPLETPTTTISPSGTSPLVSTPSTTASVVISFTPTLSPSIQLTHTAATPTIFPSGTATIMLTPTPSVQFLPTLIESATPTITPVLTATAGPSDSLTPTNDLTPDIFLTQLVINEIHADPDPELGDADADGTVHSDNDEFLELVNISEDALDLGGWQVWDLIRMRFTFPAGTSLSGGCGLVLFGGDVEFTYLQGSQVFGAGTLALNNTGDTIYLFDDEEKLMLTVSYGPEGGEDQSLTLFPDLIGQPTYYLHRDIIEAEGRLFSPGTKVDGTAIGDCP